MVFILNNNTLNTSYAQSDIDWSTNTTVFGNTGGVLRIVEDCSGCGIPYNDGLVPVTSRNMVPVVYEDNNIYGGTGYGIFDTYHVTPNSNNYSNSNWLNNYVNPYAGLYNSGSGSSGSGASSGSSNINNSNSSVNNSGNTYDNSVTNWTDNSINDYSINTSTNYSFCNGNNNCNNTNTTVISNPINGNYNNVNTSANNTGSQMACGTGYSAINGNCVQDRVSTPIYTAPVPIHVNTTPIYNNIYNNIYSTPTYTTPTYYNHTQYKTCNNNTTIPVWQSCYKYCSITGTNILETETCQKLCANNVYVYEYQSCPINYNNNYVYGTPIVYVIYPTVRITASPMIINAGESTQLNWAASNASYCTASNGWTGSPTLIGNRTVNNLTHNMTFTITCYNSNGQSVSDTVSVIVNNNAPYNKAVTTIPNNITNSSAVCNGVGIVNTHVSTNGWFEISEYDVNNNVISNSNTNSAYIGVSSSNYYSAPINGLKSNTKYSCRAVINNSYGIWKGEPMAFRTSGANISYITHIVTVKNTANKVKGTKNTKSKVAVVKPSTIECVDTNGNKMTLANGQKLITLNINKVNSNIVKGEINSYTVTIKNISKVDVKDVNIQLAMDKSLIIVDNSTFETTNDKEALLYKVNIGVLGKGEEKTFIIKVKTRDTTNINKTRDTTNINNSNKSINNNTIVTTVTASYIVATSKGDMKDEVNVYSIDNIVDPVSVNNINNEASNTVTNTNIKNINLSKDDNLNKDDILNKDGSNNVNSKTLGQIIDSMSATEWLAVLAMLVIIAILSRNVWVAIENKRIDTKE